jgi:hypothetical protein
MAAIKLDKFDTGRPFRTLLTMAVLGTPLPTAAHYEHPATIDGQGDMWCNLVTPHGTKRTCLGSTIQFRDMFRRIADAANLNDQERTDFFLEVSKFIGRDLRVESTI